MSRGNTETQTHKQYEGNKHGNTNRKHKHTNNKWPWGENTETQTHKQYEGSKHGNTNRNTNTQTI